MKPFVSKIPDPFRWLFFGMCLILIDMIVTQRDFLCLDFQVMSLLNGCFCVRIDCHQHVQFVNCGLYIITFIFLILSAMSLINKLSST